MQKSNVKYNGITYCTLPVRKRRFVKYIKLRPLGLYRSLKRFMHQKCFTPICLTAVNYISRVMRKKSSGFTAVSNLKRATQSQKTVRGLELVFFVRKGFAPSMCVFKTKNMLICTISAASFNSWKRVDVLTMRLILVLSERRSERTKSRK